MERRHARYPFLEGAREAVEAADEDIAELVATGGPVIERARDRVESALTEGHAGVGEPAGMARSNRVELLSYPIARILVSLLEEPMAIDAYARSEAATARARLEADMRAAEEAGEPELGDTAAGGAGPGAPEDAGLDVQTLIGEFGLGDVVTGRGPFEVDVATYLELSSDLEGEGWRLVDRALAEGTVPVDRTELHTLLERAVADHVEEGLPLSVPGEIADHLAAEREAIEDLVADPEIPLTFDVIEPDVFPPCVRALLERARDGDSLPPHSQYALVGFLGATGMDADAIVELGDGTLDRETVSFQLDHVLDEGSLEYAPPSCASMVAYGDCVNRDERCDTIDHPLSYYESALSAMDGE